MEHSREDQALGRLLATSSKLNVLGVLSDGEIQRVTEAKNVLTTVQKSDRHKKYKLFLYDVLGDSGPGAVLLCAIALGQARITALKTGDRTNLCRRIQVNQSALSYPAICALSTTYQIPSSVNGITSLPGSLIVLTTTDIPSSLPTTVDSEDDKQPVKRPRTSKTTDRTIITPLNETQSELKVVSKISSNDPNISTAQEQRVIENASLQGIAKVFYEYMCGAIRRVTVDSDLKAAVTMVFPVWGGPVDCLMSLDVCERDVEQLAMALFNAKVKWAERVLHVVLIEGTKLIIPNSEVTLKGVRDEAIIKVFGPEIHNAISESPVRKTELQEGKHVTECVSMILTKNGAIVNLCLGLKGGLEIQNKLYT